MSYDFNTHTIQIPCLDLLNYIKCLCDEYNVKYEIYYISKFNPNIYWEDIPDIPESQYVIELDFHEENNRQDIDFVKYLYNKHCDNIMVLESKYINSINKYVDNYHEACGFISYVL